MLYRLALLAALTCASVSLCAQSGSALQDYFAGKTVVVKVDMPAGKAGIDVYPNSVQPLNNVEYAKRLKQYGVALGRNRAVIVTAVRVKDKSIEFQLGGEDGPGAAGEDGSTLAFVTADKTPRERALERDLRNETDPTSKEKMQKELDDLRKLRSWETARLEADLLQAEAARDDSSRKRSASAGSRFNLIFPAGVPDDAVRPEYVKAALKPWIDFGAERQPAPPKESAFSTGPRKGMSEAELTQTFGDPIKRESNTIGDLHAEVLTFKKDGSVLEATMVEGILVRYKQWSE